MAKNSIGGFFVDLGLNLDKHSFETGNKYIDGMANGFSKLIGTARNAAVVLATTAIASGAVSSAELKVATAMGVATEALDTWKAAANIAGVNANGLVSSMGQLASVMNHLTVDGSGLERYASQLGKLQLDFEKLQNMSPDEAYRTILETAQSKIAAGEDALRITTIVGDILGDAGQKFFIELQRKGVSVGDFLTGAAATQYTSEENKNKGANFISEVNITKESLKSLGKLFGNELGGELTNVMKDLNNWVSLHGEEIATALTETAKLVGDIAIAVEPLVSELASDITGTAKAVAKLVTGDTGGAADAVRATKTGRKISAWVSTQQEIDNWREAHGYGTFEKVDRKLLPEELQNRIAAQETKYKKFGNIKDGIIRPDGQITQVAPDDWVIAARNLGDLARAFIPQGMATGAGEVNTYSIVQNFTINGARDTAQVIRQQAFNGTRDGLMSVSNNSAIRLQQMSGTR